MKNAFLEHYAHNSLFKNIFCKWDFWFSKMDIFKNVQNQKKNFKLVYKSVGV